MHTKRIIPCLDVKDARVVKGINFVNLRDAGDPIEVGRAYGAAGADEFVFLDITASSDARAIKTELVRKVAERVFIPFTVGGGIRTVEDFRDILREGADKVACVFGTLPKVNAEEAAYVKQTDNRNDYQNDNGQHKVDYPAARIFFGFESVNALVGRMKVAVFNSVTSRNCIVWVIARITAICSKINYFISFRR